MKGNFSRVMMFLTSIMGSISYSSAFWFSAPEVPKSEPSARLLYSDSYNNYKQYVPSHHPPMYTVPFPVPLPQQASIQNVQLVPCLCPVTQEYPYENQNEHEVYYEQPPRKNNGAFVQTSFSNLGQFAPAGQYQAGHVTHNTHANAAQRK